MSPDTQNMEKHRAALRAQDLRPIQVWVPDTRAPDCADECARRAAIVNEANCADPELVPFMDATAAELLDTLEAGHQE